jgi:Flp pilus assembly protein TadB
VGSDDVAQSTRSDRTTRRGVPAALVLGALAVAGGSVWVFRTLDPIIAAFVAILGVTTLVIAVVARDWDRHSTFEERELARAQKRKAKWEAGKAARDRDRARWEAHQARQAKKNG